MACTSDGGCSGSCMHGSGACPSCGNGCSSGCSFCSTSCGDDCTGGCRGGCSGCDGCRGCGGACSFSCSGSCDSGCDGSCENSCNGCTGSCTDACNNGCTGGNVTAIYTNLTLQTLIKANDIINLNNLVNNEVTRRSKSATSTTINVGNLATATTINVIIENLNKVAPTQSALKARYNIMDRSSMQALINIAKDLYTKNIKT